MGAVVPILRDAIRHLTSAPGHAAALIATLSLAIGATTALFSVVYGVLLRPLPYPEADRLVVVEAAKEFASAIVPGNFSAAELPDWRDHNRAFAAIAMHGADGLTFSTSEGLERVTARTVSPDFFRALGLPMALGRALADDHEPVIVVTHGFWVRRLGADPQVVGRQIVLSERAYTVVGVAPPELQFPSARIDVFTPMAFTATVSPERFGNRNRGGFQVFGRLKAGVTLAQADEDVSRVHAVLEPHHVEFRRGTRVRVASLLTYATGVSDIFGHRTSVRPALLVLFAAVGLALLAACANAANLMLARQATYARELAVRMALGATRRRLLIEHLVASGIIAAAAGGLGTMAAFSAVRVLRYLEPPQLPRLADIALDAPVLGFSCLAIVVTLLLTGLGPAYRASRVDVHDMLRATGWTQASDRRARRLRAALVVAQIAAGVVLLVGASLLGRSLWRLLDTDLGVTRENVITAFVDLTLARIPPERQQTIVNAMVERARVMPGVVAAGAGVGLPPSSLYMRRNFSHPHPVSGEIEQHVVNVVPATPGYFDALGIRLRNGRVINHADVAGAQKVMVITQDAARRYFGERDPIGLSLPVGSVSGETVVIVGVVDDVRYTGLTAAVEPVVYVPFAQLPFGLLHVAVRTSADPSALASNLRGVIRSVDPQASVVSIRTLDEVLSEATAEPRVRTLLLATIAGLAVLLSAIGLYSVVAYSVSRRTAEIGLRVALGAGVPQVFGMVMREGATIAAVGAMVGVAVALAVTRVLRSMLYGVEPTDVTSFVLAAAALVAIALAASYLPVRRAAQIDPVVALRAN